MKQHNIFWGSSYDRGLDVLLKMWPDVLAKYPDAELHITYGWDLFDRGFQNNPERMAWKERINKQMEQKGITHHGRVGKSKLEKIRKQCGIWAYPTYFTEINCITALECQKDGVVPVVMELGALTETVKAGFIIKGDIYDDEPKQEYLDTLIKLMGDEKLWQEESKKAKEAMTDYNWDLIAERWSGEF